MTVTNVQSAEDIPNPATEPTGSDVLGKDAFFTLMITQLQYQDPLDPMDNSQFIDQLAQLTQVEELQKANLNLQEMIVGLSSVNNATMVNLMGQEIKAQHDGIYYPGEGDKTIHVDLQDPAATVSIAIYDEDDRLIRNHTIEGAPEGMNDWTWHGLTSDGSIADEGQYTVKVTAVDAEGNAVASNTLVIGTIEELDYSTGQAVPIVDNQVLSLAQIISLVSPTDENVDE